MSLDLTLTSAKFKVEIYKDQSYRIFDSSSDEKTVLYMENVDLILDIAKEKVEFFNDFCQRMMNSES